MNFLLKTHFLASDLEIKQRIRDLRNMDNSTDNPQGHFHSAVSKGRKQESYELLLITPDWVQYVLGDPWLPRKLLPSHTHLCCQQGHQEQPELHVGPPSQAQRVTRAPFLWNQLDGGLTIKRKGQRAKSHQRH